MMRFFRSRRFATVFVLIAALPLISSCYIPDQFRAEIRMARNGDYSLTYDGILTWVPLYMGIRDGSIKGEEARDRIEIIRRDLKRDTQFTDVRSLGTGQFHIKYKRTGNLATKAGLITFVRRNARILDIDSRANGIVTIKAYTPNMDKARPLAEAGLLIRGSLRVMTDLPLIGEHNATAVYEDKSTGYVVYDWIFEGDRPIYPKIKFRR